MRIFETRCVSRRIKYPLEKCVGLARQLGAAPQFNDARIHPWCYLRLKVHPHEIQVCCFAGSLDPSHRRCKMNGPIWCISTPPQIILICGKHQMPLERAPFTFSILIVATMRNTHFWLAHQTDWDGKGCLSLNLIALKLCCDGFSGHQELLRFFFALQTFQPSLPICNYKGKKKSPGCYLSFKPFVNFNSGNKDWFDFFVLFYKKIQKRVLLWGTTAHTQHSRTPQSQDRFFHLRPSNFYLRPSGLLRCGQKARSLCLCTRER